MRLRYFIYLVLFMTLSCVKEQEELVVPDGAVTATIPFTAVVHGSQATRASIDGPFGTGEYIFQEGDRLFIVYEEESVTKLYGVLTLIEGADTYSGTFEGTLSCVGGFSPTDETELSATLVGVGQDEVEAPATPFFTISGDKVTAVNYPDEVPYSDNLEDYVKKYSNFTSSSTFGAKNFHLEQQTVFVNFSLSHIAKACLTNPSATEIGVSIKSGDPLTTVRTFTGIPWAAGGNAHIGSVNFTGVFKTSDNIGSGQICVEDCTIPITSDDYDGNFAADQTLVANKYYSVTRSFDPQWDGFKITATADNTTVVFNYYDDADGIEYSLNGGVTWIPYTTEGEEIPLNKDDVVCFKGNRVTYENQQGDQYETPANKPIFTANKLCNISGNIMSLLRDEDDDETTIAARAFSGAFSTGSGGKTSNITYINIDPSNPLILPATVLGDRCYKNMFRQCINLTTIPALPATTVSVDCYRGMFRSCTKLKTVSIVLPASDLAQDCYREMFRDCTLLESVNKYMLPSTKLAQGCYQQMFSTCKFETAPDLPAETLVTDCYNTMFSNVKQLKSMTCLAANPNNGSYTKDWVKGVTTGDSERTFIKNSVTQDNSGSTPTTKWPRGDNGIPSGWTATDYVAPAP